MRGKQNVTDRSIPRQDKATRSLAVNRILAGLDQLRKAGACKTHLPEITSALFTIVEEAHSIILSLTGAPGIIPQSALQEFDVIDLRVWPPNPDRSRNALGYFSDKLNEKFEAGWLVEPGDFSMKRIHHRADEDSFVAITNEAAARARRSRSKAARKSTQPDGQKVEAPDVVELERWFALEDNRQPAAPETNPQPAGPEPAPQPAAVDQKGQPSHPLASYNAAIVALDALYDAVLAKQEGAVETPTDFAEKLEARAREAAPRSIDQSDPAHPTA